MTIRRPDTSPGFIALMVALLLGVAAVPASVAASQEPVPDEVIERADVIFVGTVLRTNAVASADVSASDRTGVVRVDEVIRVPEILALAAGEEVTIRFADSEGVAADSSAVFYTTLWLVGEGIAVEELDHRILPGPLTGASMDRAERGVASRLQEIETQRLQARIERADVVVLGRVVAVREASVAAMEEEPRPLTEHDPMWREAVIEVQETMKGEIAGAEGEEASITVRFSASRDVHWYRAPKFDVGQEGIFVLEGDELVSMAGTPLPGDQTEFAIVNSSDFLSIEMADRVRALARRNEDG